MAFILNDRVKETSTTTGTGPFDLDGAVEGFETFVAGVGDTNQTYYSIFLDNQWEVGYGTITDATPDTLSRDTVISSSNADNEVDFAAGEKTVICTLPASKTPSAGMDATTFINTHDTTITEDQTIASAVLAGPVSVTGTVTVTGTLVVI
jgi:hypothetical protein